MIKNVQKNGAEDIYVPLKVQIMRVHGRFTKVC
jgi:hypothetical protein